MSKRHVFEALLNTKFRWPATGDMPFVEATRRPTMLSSQKVIALATSR